MNTYQFVIQIDSEGDVATLERVVNLEELLVKRFFELRDGSNVDGHDFGSGEANIFIITPNATEAFRYVWDILTTSLPKFKAAYRDLNDNAFVILWPPDLKAFVVG